MKNTEQRLIELTQIYHAYGEMNVLESVSLTVSRGDAIGIMAPSGAGKSTLVRVLLGLESPTEGSVKHYIDKREFGVVFQEESLLPWLNVIENASLLNILNGKPVDSARLEGYLDDFGLRSFQTHMPRELSTGMKQKVVICRIMLYRPTLYLIDEGLANIDDWQRFQVCDLLRKRALGNGGALIIVTHNPADALHLADRIWIGRGRPLFLEKSYVNSLPKDRDATIRFTPKFRRAMEDLNNAQNNARH